MARPTLEEIFANPPAIAPARPTLEQIFSQPSAVTPPAAAAPAARPSLEQIFGTKPATEPLPEQSGIMSAIGAVGDVLKQPAAAAMDVLQYFDKPRGAIAGAVKAVQENKPVLEGAQTGWKENTSWKETFNPEWVKENPTAAAALGLATDVLLDPLNVLTPVKAVGLVGRGAKAVGLTKAVAPAIKAVEESAAGKRAIALGEDILGKNRIAEPVAEFQTGRAVDQVRGQDIIDEIAKFKKENPTADAAAITKFVEAMPAAPVATINPATILASEANGTLIKDIQTGIIPKQQAFETIRTAGKEIPDALLQETQRVERAAGNVIPDYVYRDDVLAAIPDAAVRSQVERIGNMIAEKNMKLSDELFQTGRLSPEQVVRFQEGSHLRRSFEKYETPEKFLEDVKKHGTPEEWQRAFTDYQTTKATGTGFGATHKVNMKDFTGRQVLSEDTLKAMKVIDDPAYRVMDTLNRGSKALRDDELLGKVNQLYGTDAATAARLSRDLPASRHYVPVPDTKSYGALAGKWVPADIARQVMGTMGTQPDNINKTLQKIVSWWKVEKLANPASIMRNLYSGIPMANVFGRVPLVALPKYMKKVSEAFLTGGKNHPLIREIRESGSLGNEWSKQELQNILGGKPTGIKKAADVAMQAFGAPDTFSRAVVYAYHRDHGMTAKQATAFANKAQFDYSQAPEWINWLSKTGAMPFAKFPFFAGKATVEALYKNPAEVTKYIKPMNQVNTEDRETIMPDYLKSKTLLPVGTGTRVVNGKPQPVQNNLDLSYILPFASDVRLGNPVTDAMIMSATGKNAIGQQVIKPGMTTGEKAKEWANYIYNAAGPSFPLPGNYAGDKLYNAATGRVDSKGRQYDMTSAALQTFAGLKNVPINEQELAKQKITALKMQQRDIVAMVNNIAGDKQLTMAQKKERIADHKRQMQELGKEVKQVTAAYSRLKAQQ